VGYAAVQSGENLSDYMTLHLREQNFSHCTTLYENISRYLKIKHSEHALTP